MTVPVIGSVKAVVTLELVFESSVPVVLPVPEDVIVPETVAGLANSAMLEAEAGEPSIESVAGKRGL